MPESAPGCGSGSGSGATEPAGGSVSEPEPILSDGGMSALHPISKNDRKSAKIP